MKTGKTVNPGVFGFPLVLLLAGVLCGPPRLMAATNELVFEAEKAVLNGVEISTVRPGYSGKGYVTGFDADSDSADFKVNVPADGHYLLRIRAAVETNFGSKINDVFVNGTIAGSFKVEATGKFHEAGGMKIWLNKGANDLVIRKNWGWFDLDSVILSPPPPVVRPRAEPVLSDADAGDGTRMLMKYLCDMQGLKILSGQQKSYEKDSLRILLEITGKEPAILGLDMIDYSPTRVSRGAKSTAVEDAIAWRNRGGIVAFCWHWNAPMHLIDQAPDKLWWSGFYAKATTFDLERTLEKKSSPEYKALLRDIDEIAVQLKKLQDAGVPVLWRPLHEASGGWFWWGAKGPAACVKLWRLLYDRLVDRHGLHNLIWVWSGQSKEWYPGDKFVDIIGEDVYAPDRAYGSFSDRYEQGLSYSAVPRLVALSENGTLPDPDLIKRDAAWWSWFCTWSGFIEDESKNDDAMKRKVFNHELVITLDELPDLKNYPSK